RCRSSSVRGTTRGYFTVPWDTWRAKHWHREPMPISLICLAIVRGRDAVRTLLRGYGKIWQ
ncbi:MAG: hypothetical protein ACRD5H_18595, partial [Nitrososphaerales archaeon]